MLALVGQLTDLANNVMWRWTGSTSRHGEHGNGSLAVSALMYRGAMGRYPEWVADTNTSEDERTISDALHRLQIEGLRRRSLEQAETSSPRWRLLIGLTCGHRYWVRWHRWRFPAALAHLYCPQCDVLQPVTLASRRKARKRMWLRADDLRGLHDQPPNRLG
jgi:hypothetical protein